MALATSHSFSRFPPGGVEVIKGGVADLLEWNESTRPMTAWRLYWNPRPGASLSYAGKVYPLHAASLLLIAPGTGVSTCLLPSARRPVRHLFIMFRFSGLLPKLHPAVFEVTLNDGRRRELVRLLAAAGSADMAGTELGIRAIRTVCDALEGLPAQAWNDPGQDARVRKALSLVRDRFREPLSVAAMARQVGMTAPSFIRLFRREMGESPYQYLILVRLWKARELLLNSPMSTEQVAEACGFSDRNHFSRTFRGKFGFSPATWRKRTCDGSLRASRAIR